KQGLQSPMGRWRGLVELVSAAALLHDLGHVPAGHTLEDEFSVFEKHDGLGGGRFFQMFYGPRAALVSLKPTNGPPRIEDYFGQIDEGRLPRPEPWQRVPLPWVFEKGTYSPFLESAAGHGFQPLGNDEIRDLVYLILSFKEKIRDDEYETFEEKI